MCFAWSEPRLIQCNNPALSEWYPPRSSHEMSLMSLSVWGTIYNVFHHRKQSEYSGEFVFLLLRTRKFWKYLLTWEWISLERALVSILCCLFWLSELTCMHMKDVFCLIYLPLGVLVPCNDPLFSERYSWFWSYSLRASCFLEKYIIHICSLDSIYLRVKALTLVLNHVRIVSDESDYFCSMLNNILGLSKYVTGLSIPLDSSCWSGNRILLLSVHVPLLFLSLFFSKCMNMLFLLFLWDS